MSCKSRLPLATININHGPWAYLRKACKNHDWFTSLLPVLLESSKVPPPPPPIPLWVLQRTTEGWTDLHDGGSKEGARENTSAKKKEGGKWKSRGVGSWQVIRAVQGTPNQCCVNRPPPRVDRLQGGVLHGPLGLSAEQITDGRNVAFVLKKRESRREGGRRRSSTGGWKPGDQLTSTWSIRTAGPLAP